MRRVVAQAMTGMGILGKLLLFVLVSVVPCGKALAQPSLPNIVYILADDMGMGDVRSYNATSPVNTPNIDRMATAGMRFTDAHSSDSVCTQTRYSLLTGQYAWRGAFTTVGTVAPYGAAIVSSSRLTVAEMLQQSGYSTGMFGKWHLGMNWTLSSGTVAAQNGTNVNYSAPITGGPVDNGFDTYFGIDGSANFPPYAFIRDRRTVAMDLSTPSGMAHSGSDLVQGNPFNTVNLPGPIMPNPSDSSRYDIKNALPTIVNEATSYISTKANQANPFFAYIPLTAPHEPIDPADFAIGQSGVTGAKQGYGDFIWNVDWAVKQVLDTLNDPNHDGNTSDSIANNTMVVFTSDNGAETTVSFSTSTGKVNGVPVRGKKGTIYEGGTRAPFLVQWPGHIQAGAVNGHMVQLNDLTATLANMAGYSLPANAGEDSVNIAPELLGTATGQTHPIGVTHSVNGAYAIRQIDSSGNEWKLIFTSGDGDYPDTHIVSPATTITNFTTVQLYNLASDPGESNNLLSGGGTQAMQQKALQLQWVLQYFMSTGSSANIPGDYNGDHVVTAADYTTWRNAFGNASSGIVDGDRSGFIDAGDYVLWRRAMQFLGSGAGSGSGVGLAGVPEPGAIVLVVVGIIGLFANAGRRRRAR